MNRRTLLLLPLASLLLTPSACSSPEPAYFTLMVRPGAPTPGGPKLVELRRIGLAGYLDRPEIVRNGNDYRLRITTNERWGEPLGELVARVLAEDLTSRLPGSTVFTAASSISAEPDATLELDLQRLDADAQGNAVMLVQVAVSGPKGRGRADAQTVRLSVPPATPATVDYVAAVSTALGQLADRIVPLLLAAGPASPGRARTGG